MTSIAALGYLEDFPAAVEAHIPWVESRYQFVQQVLVKSTDLI